MPKSSKKTQARRGAQEPFSAVAQRLGDSLATVLEHPDCPAEVADVICELETAVFNRHSDVAISLRHSFGPRLTAMLERFA